MYSHVGIIIGAVMSALLGLYVFVPDAGLRTFDFWLRIWQPVVWEPIAWDVPAILRLPSVDRTGANGSPLWLGVEKKDEGMMEDTSIEDFIERLRRLEGISNENFMEKLPAQPDLHGPEIAPVIPPFPFDPDPLAHLVPFHKGVVMVFFFLCQHFALFVLPCLIPIALVQKIYTSRKLRNLYEAEKRKNAELVEKLKSKEVQEKEKGRDDQGK